jgi:DNA-binding CsgD family transcriptional regulator
MSAMERVRDLAFAFYDAPLEPTLWPELMARVVAASQSDIAGVCSYYEGTQHWWFSYLDPKMRLALQRHTNGSDNVVEKQALQQPQPRLIQTARWVPAGFAESAFYREVLQSHGFPAEGGCVGDLLNDGRDVSRFAAFRQSRKPYDSISMRNLSYLWPHLVQAVRLTLKLRPPVEADRSHVLDLCLLGVIAVDSSRRVLEANATARRMLDRGEALACRQGRLVACAEETRARLDRALSAVLKDERAGTESCLLSTVFEDRLLAVHVMRSTSAIRRALGVRVAALVLVQNPAEHLRCDRRVLQRLYGLTPAEATVAAHIAGGATVAGIAALLGLSRNTVRSHLYRVFDKLQVTHQSELTRLLLTGPALLAPFGDHRRA